MPARTGFMPTWKVIKTHLIASHLVLCLSLAHLHAVEVSVASTAHLTGSGSPMGSVANSGMRGRLNKQILVPAASNKRIQGSDFHLGVFLQAIWFDIVWDTSNLRRPADVVRGFIVISDVSGEPRLRFVHVIRHLLIPGQDYTETGVGFEYDPAKETHRWIRATGINEMTFTFEVTEIVYQDGGVDKF